MFGIDWQYILAPYVNTNQDGHKMDKSWSLLKTVKEQSWQYVKISKDIRKERTLMTQPCLASCIVAEMVSRDPQAFGTEA